MTDKEINWDLIEVAARALGVKDANLSKWRVRKSVPHKYRLPLIEHTKGRISAEVFKAMPGDARR